MPLVFPTCFPFPLPMVSSAPSPLRTWLRFPRSCSWLLAPTHQLGSQNLIKFAIIYPNHSGKCTWSVRREFGTCFYLCFSSLLQKNWWHVEVHGIDRSVQQVNSHDFGRPDVHGDTAGWPAQLQNDSQFKSSRFVWILSNMCMKHDENKSVLEMTSFLIIAFLCILCSVVCSEDIILRCSSDQTRSLVRGKHDITCGSTFWDDN